MNSSTRVRRDGERNLKVWVLLLACIVMMLANGADGFSVWEFLIIARLAEAVARTG